MHAKFSLGHSFSQQSCWFYFSANICVVFYLLSKQMDGTLSSTHILNLILYPSAYSYHCVHIYRPAAVGALSRPSARPAMVSASLPMMFWSTHQVNSTWFIVGWGELQIARYLSAMVVNLFMFLTFSPLLFLFPSHGVSIWFPCNISQSSTFGLVRQIIYYRCDYSLRSKISVAVWTGVIRNYDTYYGLMIVLSFELC